MGSGRSASARPDWEHWDMPGEWAKRAHCKGMDVNLFFPGTGYANSPEARQVCEKCEVQKPCLEYALKNGIQHGLWGGMSERARRGERRKRRMGAA